MRPQTEGSRTGRLDGVWKVVRESGALPPFGVSKRIFGAAGWTLLAGAPAAHFKVRRPDADHAGLDTGGLPGRAELVARDSTTWDGRGLLLGREFCRFRLEREDV